MFLQLWKEKMAWSMSWDQTALAESILELVGIEIWKVSGGRKGYLHYCTPLLFPQNDGFVHSGRYCDCWQWALNAMIGPFGHRKSHLVGFVNPERVDVNYVGNNLFANHGYTLQGLRLAKQHAWAPQKEVLSPFVVHWAGIGGFQDRMKLVKQYLWTFNTTLDAWRKGCPFVRQAPADSPLGTQARKIRCNELKEEYSHHVPSVEDLVWWGCDEGISEMQVDILSTAAPLWVV